MGPMSASDLRSLERELNESLGGKHQLLTAGSGPAGKLVVCRETLCCKIEDSWREWGWDEVLNGSWSPQTSTFVWSTTGGEQFSLTLEDTGRVPEAFRERIQASTILTESHVLPTGRIEIIGRRRLDGSAATRWFATAAAGASLDDPQVAALVVERTDALKAEYGLL